MYIGEVTNRMDFIMVWVEIKRELYTLSIYKISRGLFRSFGWLVGVHKCGMVKHFESITKGWFSFMDMNAHRHIDTGNIKSLWNTPSPHSHRLSSTIFYARTFVDYTQCDLIVHKADTWIEKCRFSYEKRYNAMFNFDCNWRTTFSFVYINCIFDCIVETFAI